MTERTKLLRDAGFKCPVMDCHMGSEAELYSAQITGPDQRQRTVHACVKHFELICGKALSDLRLEPFE